MTTKEELHAVFGPRAFDFGLFYAHEGALRFELSRGGPHLEQFAQAFDRGREILDFLFRDSRRIVVVVSQDGAGRLLRHLSLFRSLRACDIPVSRPLGTWTEPLDEEWGGEAARTLVAFRCDREALHRLLWGAVAVDLGVRPRLEGALSLADPERGILAHPYDDRGMDVIGPNRELLAELYHRFNGYLLDYDRARMDAWFGEDESVTTEEGRG